MRRTYATLPLDRSDRARMTVRHGPCREQRERIVVPRGTLRDSDEADLRTLSVQYPLYSRHARRCVTAPLTAAALDTLAGMLSPR